MPERPRILVVSFSDIHRDPRVLRQIRLLTDCNFTVDVIGFGAFDKCNKFYSLTKPNWSPIRRILGASQLALRLFSWFYWNLPHIKEFLKLDLSESYTHVVANDLWSLPVVSKRFIDSKILFDAHEYSPREYEEYFWWRILFAPFNHYLCTRYLSKAQSLITVCDGIAAEYHANYGCKMRVVPNAPFHLEIPPSPVSAERIEVVHHGAAAPARQLEKMVEIAKSLESRFHTTFILVPGSLSYLNEIKKSCIGHRNIHFQDPVATADIPAFLNRYDIGLYYLEPTSFNNLHSLPNKFFEFIQARLCLAIGPNPEMKNILNRYSLGIHSSSFDPKDLANAINHLSVNEIVTHKNNCAIHAKTLSYDTYSHVITDFFER